MVLQALLKVWMILCHHGCGFERTGQDVCKQACEPEESPDLYKSNLQFSIGSDDYLLVKVNPLANYNDYANYQQGVLMAHQVIGKQQQEGYRKINDQFKVK